MLRALAATLLVFIISATSAQVMMLGVGPGGSSGATTYTGPADVVASPKAWWGLRAMSTADRGNKLVNVCNVSDVVCADLSSDATTGALVIGTIGGSSCSVVVCTIKTWYDRSGNGFDITQATIAKRYTLTVSCVSSLPCAVGLSASAQCYIGTTNATIGQPYTVVYGAERTGAFTSFQTLFDGATNDTSEVGFHNNANKVYMAVVSTPSAAAADSTWHAVQNIFATGSTNSITVDGSTTGSLSTGGTGGLTAEHFIMGSYGSAGACGAGAYLTGNFVEGGFWPVGFSAGNLTAMNSNIHSYWGF